MQHERKMTIFYSKSDGKIKGLATGIQDMNFYGEDTEDFGLIRDYVVLDLDKAVFDNYARFKINTATKEVELMEEYAFQPEKYKIANRNMDTEVVIEAEKSMEGLKDENYKTI